jgi:hypothetical protein
MDSGVGNGSSNSMNLIDLAQDCPEVRFHYLAERGKLQRGSTIEQGSSQLFFQPLNGNRKRRL